MNMSCRTPTFLALSRAWQPGVWGITFSPAVAGVLLACASPTLPLPPPGYPSVGAGEDADHVVLASPCGGVQPGATVVIINDNTSLPSSERGTVSFADECGAWSAEVYAHAGDWLDIWQEWGTSKSDSVPVLVSISGG